MYASAFFYFFCFLFLGTNSAPFVVNSPPAEGRAGTAGRVKIPETTNSFRFTPLLLRKLPQRGRIYSVLFIPDTKFPSMGGVARSDGGSPRTADTWATPPGLRPYSSSQRRISLFGIVFFCHWMCVIICIHNFVSESFIHFSFATTSSI